MKTRTGPDTDVVPVPAAGDRDRIVRALTFCLLAFVGLVVSNVPYLVPPVMTVWQAASHPTSQIFYLVGAAILIPMIIGYTAVVFYLFRGKLDPGQGYH